MLHQLSEGRIPGRPNTQGTSPQEELIRLRLEEIKRERREHVRHQRQLGQAQESA